MTDELYAEIDLLSRGGYQWDLYDGTVWLERGFAGSEEHAVAEAKKRLVAHRDAREYVPLRVY